MFEFLFEIFGEILLQVVLEALAELGLHCLVAPFRKPPDRWLAAIGYAIFGAVTGGISLWLFPENFVVGKALRLLNLALTLLQATLQRRPRSTLRFAALCAH